MGREGELKKTRDIRVARAYFFESLDLLSGGTRETNKAKDALFIYKGN